MLEEDDLCVLHPYSLLVLHSQITAGNSKIRGFLLFMGSSMYRMCLRKLPRRTRDEILELCQA